MDYREKYIKYIRLVRKTIHKYTQLKQLGGKKTEDLINKITNVKLKNALSDDDAFY